MTSLLILFFLCLATLLLIGLFRFKLVFGKYSLYENIKLSLLVIFLVTIFYKVELIYFAKSLSLSWLLPIIYATSTFITILLKKIMENNKRNAYCRHNTVKCYHLVLLSFVTFIFSSFLIISANHLSICYDYIYYIIPFILDIPFLSLMCMPLTLTGGNNNSFINNFILKMDDTNPFGEGSSKDVPTVSEKGNLTKESSPPLLDFLDYQEKVAKLNELNKRATDKQGRLNKLITDLMAFRVIDIRLVEEQDGSLGIDLPADFDDAKADLISKRVGVIDRVFNRHCDDINSIFKESDDICAIIKGRGTNVPKIIAEVEKLKTKYNNSIDSYKRMIDEA